MVHMIHCGGRSSGTGRGAGDGFAWEQAKKIANEPIQITVIIYALCH